VLDAVLLSVVVSDSGVARGAKWSSQRSEVLRGCVCWFFYSAIMPITKTST
jgi:hypothetical protein